ncbi:MAG: non-canonical purine NTP pyrophosphatase [Microgenomates group bacterium]
MKLKRLIFGTTNPAKLKEWSELLESVVPLVGISEFGELPKPRESGKSFAENAREKASHYAKLTGEYVISEDGGYEIDVLGGAPGIMSRRILPGGKDGTDQELIDFVLKKLKNVPFGKRTVKLTTSIALSDPKGNIIFEGRASSKGVVCQEPGPILIPGYPYRTIHFFPKLGKTYAELTRKERKKYSHKKKIARRLTKFLLE